MAHDIQVNLLPKSNPDIPGYDIAGKSIPALSVGGDYYDFIPIDENNLIICLGDISGKGMPAALLMSNLQATIRGQALIAGAPKECIIRTNSMLFHSTATNKFATLFYGILDMEMHKFCYTNAGHNPPLLYKDDAEPILLKTGGPIVGFMDGISYPDDTVSFNGGDVCVIYSDGITEAMDVDENEYGEEPLESFVKDNRNLSSNEMIEKIFETVRAHAGRAPQSDDMTVVVIKRI